MLTTGPENGASSEVLTERPPANQLFKEGLLGTTLSVLSMWFWVWPAPDAREFAIVDVGNMLYVEVRCSGYGHSRERDYIRCRARVAYPLRRIESKTPAYGSLVRQSII